MPWDQGPGLRCPGALDQGSHLSFEKVGNTINKERYTEAWDSSPYALLVLQMVVPVISLEWMSRRRISGDDDHEDESRRSSFDKFQCVKQQGF